MTEHELPEAIQQNLDNLMFSTGGDFADAAAFINARAGRIPTANPTVGAICNQFNLIESEILEAKKAAMENDIDRVRDAAVDCILLAAGIQGVVSGLNLNEDYNLMLAYNMTRIPQTLDDAEATVAKYRDIGVETEIHPMDFLGQTLYPVRTVGRSQTATTGEHFVENKFVKCVKFTDVAYPPLPIPISIQLTDSCKSKTGELITKHIAQQLTKEVVKRAGEYGTIPVQTLIKLIESLEGQRV